VVNILFPSVKKNMRGRVLESEGVWLWSIVILGGILRLYRLDFQSLWVDEGLQYYVATNNSIAEMLFTQMRSFHPPLSFLVNHAFLLIGESEFFLRLPSILFGIGSLPLLYILTRELTSTRVALLATFVLAISPFHIWYSQDGRMYAQVLFFSLLSSVVLLRAINRGGVRWWVYYILVGAAGMYTHVFMVLALTAQFLWVLLYHRDRLMAHMASGVSVFVLFLPWTLFLPWVQGFFQGVSERGLGAGNLRLDHMPHSGRGFHGKVSPIHFSRTRPAFHWARRWRNSMRTEVLDSSYNLQRKFYWW
jgi:uncharacterized membrane protein